MMDFKNRSVGFTLVEVLIALVVFAMAMGPLLLQQGASLRAISGSAHQWKRFSSALHFMVNTARTLSQQQSSFTLEKKLDDPAMIMKFTTQKVADRSVVRRYKNLHVQSVEYQWTDGKGAHKETLQQFVVLPPEAPKE